MKPTLMQAAISSVAVFLVAIIFQAFITMGTNHNVPRVYGYSLLYVSTDSMDTSREDSVPKGAGILIHRTSPNQLQIGDVITFYDKNIGAPNTHRLDDIALSPEGEFHFHTMGDNYQSDRFLYEGESFTEKEYIGKVLFSSKLLGRILSAVSLEASVMSGDGREDFFYLYPYVVILPLGISAVLVLVHANVSLYRRLKKEDQAFEAYFAKHQKEAINKEDLRKRFETGLDESERHDMWISAQQKIGLALGKRGCVL